MSSRPRPPAPVSDPDRRRFLRWGLEALLLPVAAIGAAMVTRQRQVQGTDGTRELVVPRPSSGTATVHGEAIVADPGRGPLALSSRCPHLGCRVDRVAGGELVCPCHGSRFALDGAVTRGPATMGLQPLSWSPTADGTGLRVRLNA